MLGEIDPLIEKVFLTFVGGIATVSGGLAALFGIYNLRMSRTIERLEKEVEKKELEIVNAIKRYSDQHDKCEEELSRMTAEVLKMAEKLMVKNE